MANSNLGQCKCPICKETADIRETKKFKAYIMCDGCGFQGFARGSIANAKIRALIEAGEVITEKEVKELLKPAVEPIKTSPAIVRHTADGENVPGVQITPPPAKELTIFDKEFYK